MGAVIGFCTLEARQERVVDVDHPPRPAHAEFGRQHLHVAGEHDQFGAQALHRLDQPRLLGRLARVHRQVVERRAGGLGQVAQILVIGDHRLHRDGQGADAGAVQQVVEAMAEPRHQDHRRGRLGLVVEAHVHAVTLGHRGEAGLQPLRRQVLRCVEQAAKEEAPVAAVAELGALQHVAALAGQIARRVGHHADAVGTGQGDDVGPAHGEPRGAMVDIAPRARTVPFRLRFAGLESPRLNACRWRETGQSAVPFRAPASARSGSSPGCRWCRRSRSCWTSRSGAWRRPGACARSARRRRPRRDGRCGRSRR